MAELNFHHLRYFHTVAHEGNLTRAAERLNVSQSAVSSQIRLLEDRLGQPLFERRGRTLILTEAGRIALDHADTINSLVFSPNRYWLCAATGPSIKIWDLESKNMVEELRPEVAGTAVRADPPQCLSMAWSADGQTLFAGYSDNLIRVWQVSVSTR